MGDPITYCKVCAEREPVAFADEIAKKMAAVFTQEDSQADEKETDAGSEITPEA